MSTLSRRNFIKRAAPSSVAGLGVYGCAANAKREGGDGYERESGGLDKRPDGVANVADNAGHGAALRIGRG